MDVSLSDIDGAITAYMTAQNLDNATQNELQAHLTALQNRDLPLVSTRLPTRFKSNARFTFHYFGREALATLITKFESDSYVLQGAIGSGKSHIAAAYALYHHMMRRRNLPGFKRVVYVSSCSIIRGRMLTHIIFAFKMAFGDVPNVLQANPTSWDQLRQLVITTADTHPNNKILFLYDDFNFLLETKEATLRAIKDEMERLTDGFQQVSIVSYSAMQPGIGSAAGSDEHVTISPSFSATEWAAWRITANRPAWANAAHEEDEVKYMTGLNPLFLTRIAYPASGNVHNSFTEAVNEYLSSSGPEGGMVILSYMDKFVRDHIIPADLMSDFIHHITHALAGNSQGGVNLRLVDFRFYYLDGTIVTPVCGCVSWLALKMLDSLKQRF